MSPADRDDTIRAILADGPKLMKELIEEAKLAGLSRDRVYRSVKQLAKRGEVLWVKRAENVKAVAALKEHEKEARGLARGIGVPPPELLALWVDIERKIIEPLLDQLPAVALDVRSPFFGVYTVPYPRTQFGKNVKLDVEKEPLFEDLGNYPRFKPVLKSLDQFRRGSDEFWEMKMESRLKIYRWIKSRIRKKFAPKEWISKPSEIQLEWLAEDFLKWAISLVGEGKDKFDRHLKDLREAPDLEGLLVPYTGLPETGGKELGDLFIGMLKEIRESKFSTDAVKLYRKLRKLESLRLRIEEELKTVLAQGRSPGGLWTLLK